MNHEALEGIKLAGFAVTFALALVVIWALNV
ncbi:hypothetical protein MARI_19400 [Marinobacter sp. JH2]|nr:hypothetical protein MARI_19400 [Marinobacter sp. JH2]